MFPGLQDPTPVQDKGPPKSITVEDSFKDCSSMQAAEHVLRVLAPDLLARMVEDYQVCPLCWHAVTGTAGCIFLVCWLSSSMHPVTHAAETQCFAMMD